MYSFVGVNSIWGSVSRLTCHIVSSCTRSCHPRSAITAALCFTVFINRVINAKVSERFYLFISTLLLWEVANTSALPYLPIFMQHDAHCARLVAYTHKTYFLTRFLQDFLCYYYSTNYSVTTKTNFEIQQKYFYSTI